MLIRLLLLFVLISLAFGGKTNSTVLGKLGKLDPFHSINIRLDHELLLALTGNNGKKGNKLEISIIESSKKEPVVEKLELNGKPVEIVAGPSENNVQVSFAKGTRLVESLDFVIEQLYRDSPNNKHFKFIVNDKSKQHWKEVADVLRAGHAKAEKLFTFLSDEGSLLDVIKATKVKAVYIASEHSKDEKAVVLSDTFFQEQAVQNLESFYIARDKATSELTDETLSKLKAKELTLDAAPKLSQVGVRRFLQTALDGKGNRSVGLAPSFKFNENDFFKGVNVKKVASKEGEWEGSSGGSPKSVIVSSEEGGLSIAVLN